MSNLENSLPDGALVNFAQQRMMQQMFNLGPWSYVHENPFNLLNRLKEQEEQLRKMKLAGNPKLLKDLGV